MWESEGGEEVEGGGEWTEYKPESFLTSRIPYLQFHSFSIDNQTLHSEIDSDSCSLSIDEGSITESLNDTTESIFNRLSLFRKDKVDKSSCSSILFIYDLNVYSTISLKTHVFPTPISPIRTTLKR